MAEEMTRAVATDDPPAAPSLFPPPRNHIRFDEQGRPWLEGTTIKVMEIVLNHLSEGGTSAEVIFDNLPHIPLEKIHAGLAYYYDNKAVFDEQIRKDDEEYQRLWAEQGETPLRKRLREQGLLR